MRLDLFTRLYTYILTLYYLHFFHLVFSISIFFGFTLLGTFLFWDFINKHFFKPRFVLSFLFYIFLSHISDCWAGKEWEWSTALHRKLKWTEKSN